MKKQLTIDLRTGTMLGPVCILFWSLKYYENERVSLKIINKHWSLKTNDGLKFDKKSKKYLTGESVYLWDSNLHPNDLLYNLILPTFSNIKIIEKKYSFISRLFLNIPPFYSNNNIHFIDFISFFMSKEEKKNLINQHKNYYYKNKNLIELLRYKFKEIYINSKKNYKIKPISMPFRYKINTSLKNHITVNNFIKKHKKNNVKYILISVLWDEEKKIEKQSDRLRGGPHFIEEEWNSLLKYVKDLDNFIIKNPKYKFILASKKAIDWQKFIKSDYLDLRNFEEFDFTLSQSLYIAQELSSVTINWPSTYSIWITNCKNIIHLTWGGYKDTAPWTRDDHYYKKNYMNLINTLCEK